MHAFVGERPREGTLLAALASRSRLALNSRSVSDKSCANLGDLDKERDVVGSALQMLKNGAEILIGPTIAVPSETNC